MTLQEVFHQWRTELRTADYSVTRRIGTKFEDLCKIFLLHDSAYKDIYESVETYAEWASKKGLPKSDLGTDLVAKIKGEELDVAIQCKFHKEGYNLSKKKDLNNFLADSSRKFFGQRILIDSTGIPLTSNVQNTLLNQDPQVLRIQLQDLLSSDIDWDQFIQTKEVKTVKPKTPYDHQEEAIAKVVSGLTVKGSRGKMVMACGTGKTFTSLRIAEELVGVGGRVLYLVPSLSLMSQTIREWTKDARILLRYYAVCSDHQVMSKARSQDDRIDLSVLDMPYPANTDPSKLSNQVGDESQHQMTVVFATYQSIEVIEKAQKVHGLPDFDLAIMDEAHRTAGDRNTKDDKKDSAFVKVHEQTNVRTHRRLYMTATPKVYSQSAKDKASQHSIIVYSMEDKEVFGPVLYEIGFGSAVEQGLLSDYKVIILEIPGDAVAKEASMIMEKHDISLDEAGKLTGCYRAIAKMDQREFGDDLTPMRRVIAYCRKISISQKVTEVFPSLAEEYNDRQREDGQEINQTIEVRHIDGKHQAVERNEKLIWLDNVRTEDQTCHVLSNVRCLSEGVDVPALDAILFLHPRRSQVEVVQAVGRVMRKSEHKQMGYIILPVVIPMGNDPVEALNNNKTFEVVWQVLNAIRSHDERFDALINLLEQGETGDRLGIISLSDWSRSKKNPDSIIKRDDKSKVLEYIQGEIPFEFIDALKSKIVHRCGDRKYWSMWAGDIADIAKKHIDRIRGYIHRHEEAKQFFDDFLIELWDDLNDGISEEDAIEMLAQHSITRPIFNALHGDSVFVDQNPISKAMDQMLKALEPANIETETESLDKFYESVANRAKAADTLKKRQNLLIELYDNFFSGAFKKTSDMYGVVYTPVEIVDFILNSVNDVLQDEFGKTLSSEGVQILDPFTGTGTFITRMIQNGLVDKGTLPHKYRHEIHANEIMLLAYYIAAVKIETAYHQMMEAKEYEPFSGILLTDTFAMNEGDDQIADLMPENSERIERQKSLGIQVIVGNPPWRAGQKSQNDAAQNQSYPLLRNHIETSYVKHSFATLTKPLYNSYIQAMRWASDRIGDSGVIGFVTPSNWLVGNAMDGMRKCLGDDFSTIYVLNLGGDTVVDRSANVFDGIKTANAISILVKNPESTEHKILYHEIEHFTDRAKKINRINSLRSIRGLTNQWREINPDRHYDWLNQRDPEFEEFMAIGDKKNPSSETIFKSYSLGVATNRDAWCYNYSEALLRMNVQSMIRFYEGERQRLMERDTRGRRLTPREITEFVDNDSTKISWTRALKNDLAKNKVLSLEEGRVTIAQYRPFTRTHMYFSRRLNEMVLQIPQLFPHEEAENLVICVTGRGSTKPFSCIMTDIIPDLELISKSQCFPRWLYKKPNQKAQEDIFGAESTTKTDSFGYIRESAINEKALQGFTEKKCPPPIFLTTYSTTSTVCSMSLPIEKNTRRTSAKSFPESHPPKILNSSCYLQKLEENLENSMLTTKM